MSFSFRGKQFTLNIYTQHRQSHSGLPQHNVTKRVCSPCQHNLYMDKMWIYTINHTDIARQTVLFAPTPRQQTVKSFHSPDVFPLFARNPTKPYIVCTAARTVGMA